MVVFAVGRTSEGELVFSKLDFLALNFGDLESEEELVFSLSPNNGGNKRGSAVNLVRLLAADGELKKIEKRIVKFAVRD